MPTHYPFHLDAAAHPDFARRPIKVPTWTTFGDRPQLMTLRDLAQPTWKEDLERYTVTFELGRIVWPNSYLLYTSHVDQVIEEILKRDLFLFDLWGYVPGSATVGPWANLTPPPGMVNQLRRVLGDRFLGMDNGEQDGRYVGGYAPQQCPSPAGRFGQYLNFKRHFERLGNDLGNHLSALVSLCFGHYFLKEGNHSLLGAEAAQALPNSQVYYAFIRGAGKQYGIHWFGNASCFNRWGYKLYKAPGAMKDGEGMSEFGPERGTSLNLLKRLIYTHYLYNCIGVGFELGYLTDEVRFAVEDGDKAQPWYLSPVGAIQRGIGRLIAREGHPGVMHTPVALLLDFHAGWAMPRHLYTGNIYQVWGALPYEAGDYLTHGVLSLLYPGYENASYYRDERGFLADTPYGDMADALLSDAPASVLRQYGLVVAAGALTPSLELRDKLRTFVDDGGELVVTAVNAAWLFPEWAAPAAAPQRLEAGTIVKRVDGTRDTEAHAFDLASLALPDGAEILAFAGKRPAVARIASGKGSVLLLFSPHGINVEPQVKGAVENATEKPLACPFVLLAHVRRAIGNALARQQIFNVEGDVGYITCRRGPGEYWLGIHNNGLTAQPVRIRSEGGTLRAVREIVLDQLEKGRPGYWPEGMADNDGNSMGREAKATDRHKARASASEGRDEALTMAGGDVRLFAVTLDEARVVCLPESRPTARPAGRLLALRGIQSIQEQIEARPTFFQHFDGVKVDWTYLHQRGVDQVRRESGWLERQQVCLVIDFSHRTNFYPDLCLLDTYPPQFEAARAAMDDVLEKMAVWGARDAIFTLHRRPENHCPPELAHERFTANVKAFCRRAAARGVSLHLQHHPLRWYRPWQGGYGTALAHLGLIREWAEPNLRLALNTGHAAMYDEPLAETIAQAGDRLGMVLLCAPTRDLIGQVYDTHAPIHGSGLDLAALAACPAGVPRILDAMYPDPDAEYLDLRLAFETH